MIRILLTGRLFNVEYSVVTVYVPVQFHIRDVRRYYIKLTTEKTVVLSLIQNTEIVRFTLLTMTGMRI